MFGSLVGEEPRTFLDALMNAVTATLSMFRDGRTAGCSDRTYMPLTVSPSPGSLEPLFPAASLGRLAIALSLLSRA